LKTSFSTYDDKNDKSQFPSESQLKIWVTNFIRNKHCQCNCCFHDDSLLLNENRLLNFKREFNFLSPKEQEIFILTLLQEARQPSTNKPVRPRRKVTDRIRLTLYYHVYPFGRVCRTVFRSLFSISDKKLRNLINYLKTFNFPTPRCHGNTGRIPKQTLAPEIRIRIENWIMNFAMRVGEPNWRTISSESNVNLIFLPACYTISMLYSLCLEDTGFQFSRSTFYSIFNSDACKHVRVRNPRSDMCDTCDLLRNILNSIAHKHQEGRAIVALPSAQLANHLALARAAREDYKNDQKKARKGIISHFSFDYSQNLVLPQKADQPCSFYFYSLRNVYLFGITDESCNRQMNYLMDEGECAKGSNEVMSMVWHFLKTLTPEKRAHIVFNADNCIGQNKNNTMVKFFLWQCLMGYSKSIQVKFMIKGHTHFGPDSNFSHIKKRYRRSNAFSLEQLYEIVKESSVNNKAEIIDHKFFFDFKTALDSYFKDLPEIKNYHYFLFETDRPGIVSVKENLRDEWIEYFLLKPPLNQSNAKLQCSVKPSSLQSPGINRTKQINLYEKVRKFVPDEFKDIICAKPIDYTRDKTAQVEMEGRETSLTKKSEIVRRKKASKKELIVLNKLYDETPFPSNSTINSIAAELGWAKQSVRSWFSNKRYRSKRKT
jgi:hypothetical protein